METALFSRSSVTEHVDMPTVIDAVEVAFAAYEADRAVMPPKSYVELPQYNGDFRSMPAYVEGVDWDGAGVKWVNAHPDNPPTHELPAVMGVMIYSDPETGLPLAILDGTELTRQRTAAAAAVATDYLAIKDATRLGIVGAGAQSYAQVEAISSVRDITEIVVHDRDNSAIDRFIDVFADQFAITPGSIADAGHCDILTTLTPVRTPIISRTDLGEHTHINAMGADAAGKQELEPEVLLDALIVIDDFSQCTHSGEINVPWTDGIVSDRDLHGTLGMVVLGERRGRSPDDGITVFDSTGLAIQDVAAARVIYEQAKEDVPTFDLLELG